MSELLDPNMLEDFSNDFLHRLSRYKLSYYLKKKGNNKSKENGIDSSIIWTREAVEQINLLESKSDSLTATSELILLITFIDILLESSKQIERILYNNKAPKSKNKLLFRGAPHPIMTSLTINILRKFVRCLVLIL